MLRGWVIEPRHTLPGRYPEPPGMVHIETADHSGRKSVANRKPLKAAPDPPHQSPIVKPNPEIACSIFAKSRRRRLRNSVRRRVALEGLGCPIPSGEHVVRTPDRANPNIPARILEQSENRIIRESIPYGIDGLG